MSKLTYEFTNGYLPQKQTSPTGDRIINKKNLNYIYIPSKSPPLYHNLNSVSSNTYSSYDPKLSSNNSNVSSSNESSMLNNSYHSTNDEYVEPQHKPSPVYTPPNYYDQRYTSYMPPNEVSISSKRPIKIKNLPTDKARLNETILRNKISDFKPSFNPLNKRHSVNIDSYPSTPRSNLSTPPVQDVRSSNEKLLSYEYLGNSNYDKILSQENYYSDKISEGSYSMLTGSINKDRKAKSINNVSSDYNFVAGNLEAVKGDSVAHSESPLYRKIMSKLSEIPDSMFTKASPISHNSDKMGEPAANSKNFQDKSFKQKINLSPKMFPNVTSNSATTATDDPKFVSLINVNQKNNQKGPPFRDTNFADKENKKVKYKSMYFDPKVFNDDAAPGQKVSGLQTVPNSEKVTSQAGDLIYTSMPFYSSSLPKKTSNPTYDINDYLYSDESSKINSELNKVEDNKKVNHENWMKVVGKNEEKACVNGRGKENGIVSNKNGINAYIKLIDTSQNKQKNLSSLDEFKSSGPIKYNSFSKKNQIDSSNQLNISDPAVRLSDLNSSYQSNCSNKLNYSLFPEPNYTSQYKSNDFFKPDMTKKQDLNKSVDNINKTEPKPQSIDLNGTKDTEEIEKAAIFEQSSSFSESISDIDYELLNNSAEFRRKQYKKSRPKNLKIVLSIPDSKNVAKIVSNYPVKSCFQDNKKDKTMSKNQVPECKSNIDQIERKLSNDIDQEISELTEKMDFKAKDQSKLNDSIENKYPILMRKISTPPPLPHILDAKNKRNTIHASDNIYMSINESKPASITSAIRDGKTEKPIRVGHGLPPPPPIFSQQNSFTSNLNESMSKEAKSRDTPRLNESVFTVKSENSKSDNRRPQLIKNSHVVSKAAQRDVGVKNSKKDEKLTTATNLPQLDKIDYVLKTNDDKLLTNIIPYLDDKKNNRNRREQRKLTKNFNLNEYKIDDDAWSCNTSGKNFYESYAKENDRRKKEGSGFLMLLPGIAIPIDTDAADSDESS